MATNIHTILFSKVLYPGHTMLMTASIYLTVGITFERYTAVHHPVDYNQVSTYSALENDLLLTFLTFHQKSMIGQVISKLICVMKA